MCIFSYETICMPCSVFLNTQLKCKIIEFVGRFLVSRTTLLELISLRLRLQVTTYNLRNKSPAMPAIHTDLFKNTLFNRIVFKYNVAL